LTKLKSSNLTHLDLKSSKNLIRKGYDLANIVASLWQISVPKKAVILLIQLVCTTSN